MMTANAGDHASDSSAGRLVLVGNGFPDRDLSRFVDGADVVVRFNSCLSYLSRLTGTRVDVLVLWAGGDWLELELQKIQIPPDLAKRVRELWLVRPDSPDQHEDVRTILRLGTCTIRTIDEATIDALRVKIREYPDELAQCGVTVEEALAHR